MKLEMEAPPFPPFSLFPSCLPPSPSLSFWGLRSTQDNAQSWDAQGRLENRVGGS
ncbi:rCG23549 [Rattus norvegicus]|uniref:RCG23549 n=1 Tax=Rattus norvegicus TaxID=10116 RepID=A6KGV4_RAT|nr:rCG23549 [Rattus norvegicus]